MNADIVPLDSLEFDQANTNRHTERGQKMTRRSVDVFDPRQPLELDRNGVLINGNDRASYYQEKGIKEVKVVDLEKGEVLAVRYPDFDLSDPHNPAREYQIAQARSGQVSLDFDPAAIELNLEAGMVLDDWFTEFELEEMTAGSGATAPEDFKEYDEGIDTEYCCPKCGYKWSGKPS